MLIRIICRFFLWLFGWKVKGKVPDDTNKYLVVVMPHTSTWDFIVGILIRPLLNMPECHYLAKKSLFDSKLGFLFYWLGGTPVDRSRNMGLVDQVVEKYEERERFGIAITPEGTRTLVPTLKTGFYHIASKANVPLVLGYFDFKTRTGGVGDELIYPSGDYEADLEKIKAFYQTIGAKHPEKSLWHQDWKSKIPWFANPFKFTLKLLLITVLSYLLVNYELVHYGLKQGYGQLEILAKAKPIEDFLADPNFPDSLKQRINLVQEIRQYAFDSVGLDQSNSYTKMYDQQGKPILWVVTACKPFKLENRVWNFPVLGRVSYKGFFDSLALKKEAKALKEEGWDTRVRQVNAWSTLGILNDPILSNMLYRSEGYLAEVIIHELTHGTLFIKDNLQYNENLANFVGEEGAKQFLLHKYGVGSPEYKNYQQSQPDYEQFANYTLSFTKTLDSLYNSFDEQMTYEEKSVLKNEYIERYILGMDSLEFTNPRYYGYFKNFHPNNAFFMAFVRYRASKNQFREQFENEFGSNFVNYITYLKETYPSIF